MSTGGFQRVSPLGDGFIRGPARVLVCPYTYLYPTKIGSVINLEESGYTTEVQELTKTSKEAETGELFLGFASYPTRGLKPAELTAAKVQEALEALPSIGTGGVKCTEGPLKEKNIVITFAGELAEHAQPLIAVARNTLKKGAEAATTTVTRKTAGFGLYDPIGEWSELGATKGGIKIMRNNTESLQDIDQIQAAIAALPDEWEMSVETPLVETTPENIQIAWEGGEIKLDATQTPNERHVGFGNPLSYAERRLAVIHKKTLGTSAGKLRMYIFRKVLRSATASTIDFQKTGNMATVNTTFRVFADASVADPKYSMGEQIDQVYF